MTETKTHLIADESIGGVQREYIEVDRKAEVGDYVINNKGTYAEDYYQVTGFTEKYYPSYTVKPDGNLDKYDEHITAAVSIDRSITLEPTEIVHIDGIRYQLAERNAEVGEKVIVVSDLYFATVGEIHTVEYARNFYEYRTDKCASISKKQCCVLIPVDSEPAEPTPDIEGILANLINRVTSLERITGELVRAKSSVESQLNDAIRNIERLAQELEREKEYRASIYTKLSDLKDEVESNTKDIAFLDDRTFEKPGKPTKSANELLRDILRMVEENGGAGA